LLRALRDLGIEVHEVRTIGDVVPVIAAAVRELAAARRYVFTTGGVGPTHDDVTMEGVASAFGSRVVRDPELVKLIQRFYPRATEAHLKMAEVPEGSQVLVDPKLGFVPVVRMRNVFVLPGVPALVARCFAAIAPQLERGQFFARALYLRTNESAIAEVLTATQSEHPDVAIGSYPRFDGAPYDVKITFDGRDRARVDQALATLRGRLEPRCIVSEDVEPTLPDNSH
jgi:molybdopterin-biosynthesis enzyme MoeA-like protein